MRRSQVVELYFLGFESVPPNYVALGKPLTLSGSWILHLYKEGNFQALYRCWKDQRSNRTHRVALILLCGPWRDYIS